MSRRKHAKVDMMAGEWSTLGLLMIPAFRYLFPIAMKDAHAHGNISKVSDNLRQPPFLMVVVPCYDEAEGLEHTADVTGSLIRSMEVRGSRRVAIFAS